MNGFASLTDALATPGVLAAEVSLWRVLLGLDPASGLAFNLVLLFAGMLLITKGGDWFTDSAASIARTTRIPPVIIGATIVSIATTFPEFMVSLTGVMSGVPDFAVGNALGSCACNIGLIVGSCALLKGLPPFRVDGEAGIPVSRRTLQGPGLFMLAAGLAVWAFSLFDNDLPGKSYSLARWQGGALFGLFAVYILYSLRSAMQARFDAALIEKDDPTDQPREPVFGPIVYFLIGAFVVVIGSKLLVSNAETVAILMGMPKLIVGLTILAVGTSLPEYTISLIAVIKGHGSLGMGNIIGANVLNITWVVAACALYKPLPIEWQTIVLDNPFVLLLMSLLLVLSWRDERISPLSGTVLFAAYLGYLALVFGLFGGAA